MPDENDERVAISLDPEVALRALMKVDPDDLPQADRCTKCGGKGWLWQPAALTAPPQAPSWQRCPVCNTTGLRTWHNRTPHRQKPAAPHLAG
jgi:hypothetical protein